MFNRNVDTKKIALRQLVLAVGIYGIFLAKWQRVGLDTVNLDRGQFWPVATLKSILRRSAIERLNVMMEIHVLPVTKGRFHLAEKYVYKSCFENFRTIISQLNSLRNMNKT